MSLRCIHEHVLTRWQGFIQFDVGEEEDAGKLGNVVRREKETKEKELRHLSGQAGKNLYLECFQLILRSQLLWLVNEKGHREELETVVRDLWDLRTRGSSSLVVEEDTQEGGLEMFSSQPALEEPAIHHRGFDARDQSWKSDRGSDWPMPRIVDTLVLCYLGCLLLRIPTRVGEFCRWANDGQIPYKRAVRVISLSIASPKLTYQYYDLPEEMRDRLPSSYTRALKRPLRTLLDGNDLHSAILDMALSYQLNYDMVFPAMSDSLIAVQLTGQLALPGAKPNSVSGSY